MSHGHVQHRLNSQRLHQQHQPIYHWDQYEGKLFSMNQFDQKDPNRTMNIFL